MRGLIINVIILLAAPAGYLLSARAVSVLMLLSWALLLPFFIAVYHMDAANAALPILIYDALLLVFFRYRRSVEGTAAKLASKVKDKESVKEAKREECGRFESLDEEIKERELAIVALYETTKRMSESLKFEEIFNVFSAFLKERMTFRRCELAFIKRSNGSAGRVDRTYSVWREDKGRAEYKIPYERLMYIFSSDVKSLYAAREKDDRIFRELAIEDKGVETFFAMPLLSEKKLVAIAAVENLPYDETEGFAILAAEFALEIKKVLLYEKVEELAITDSLTSLYVKRYFFERLAEEIERSKNHKFTFAFLMVDIDDFKRCNDTYGHLVGDAVLRQIGRIMKESTREIDLVARYGGEEFSLILPETNAEGARLVAERLRKKIEEHVFKAYDEKLKITVSVGIALYPDDSDDSAGIVEKADGALYAAKKSGKNVVCEYSKGYNRPHYDK